MRQKTVVEIQKVCHKLAETLHIKYKKLAEEKKGTR